MLKTKITERTWLHISAIIIVATLRITGLLHQDWKQLKQPSDVTRWMDQIDWFRLILKETWSQLPATWKLNMRNRKFLTGCSNSRIKADSLESNDKWLIKIELNIINIGELFWAKMIIYMSVLLYSFFLAITTNNNWTHTIIYKIQKIVLNLKWKEKKCSNEKLG